MRAYQWLAAVVVAGGLSSPAMAQRASTFGGGNNNRNVTFAVVDTSQSNVPIAAPANSGFLASRLTGFFHTPTPLSNARVVGTSQFPTRSQLPGIDYLKGFGFQRGRQ